MDNKLKNITGISIFLISSIIIAFIGGWIANINKLTKCDFQAPYGEEIIRVVGIPAAPLGAVIGYMTFENNNELKTKKN